MYRTSVLLAFLSLVSASSAGSNETCGYAGQDRGRLNVWGQFPGYFWALSVRDDNGAFGGFGQSSNAPRRLESGSPYANKGIQLVVLPKESESFFGYEGFVVLLVNGSPVELSFGASDSRLPIIREAF